MDAQSIQKLLDTGLSGVVILGLVYATVTLYKNGKEIQEARVKDSKEREDKLFVALQITTDEMKSIRITMDKKNGQDEK